MSKPIYLDYMATTPVDPTVAEKMHFYLTSPDYFGNPSSAHTFGLKARAVIENARAQMAAVIGAEPQEIIWTSSATEANNLALKGIMSQRQYQKRHIVTCQTEHPSVLEPCRYLEKEGCSVTYLAPKANGLIDLNELVAAVREETVLISIAHVNSEIGVIQDIQAIGQLARSRGILLHVDAAQSAGKIPIYLREWPVDLMTFSGHKVYGPKGIGALYVRLKPKVRLLAQMHGGGHESGLRSGTLATHQIVGMGEAFALADTLMTEENRRILALRTRFWHNLQQQNPDIYLNGDPIDRIAGNINMRIDGISSEALLLDLHNIAVSISSACNSVVSQASPVLKAIGLTDAQAYSSLRMSLGRFTTEAEIDETVARMTTAIARLRALSPTWPMRP